MKASELHARASEVAQALNAAGHPMEQFTGRDGGQDRTVHGWQLLPGTYTTFREGRKHVDSEWKDFASRTDMLVLEQSGALWFLDRSAGATSDIDHFDNSWLKRATPERLVGTSGAPFGQVISALDRLEAVAT